MNLFELAAVIKLDSSKYEQGIKNATKSGKGLASTIGSKLATAAKVGTAAVATVGSGISALGTYAAKVGGDFEAQMSKVSAISGATGNDLQALEDKAKQLGIDTKFSATEAGQAFEYMAMAGWKTEQMLDGVAGIMDLAAASGEDLAMVSDIVTDAMTAFGLSADQSTHFADVLAKASSNSNTNVSLMGETFKYVAPVAGAMGYSIEDTAVAIGLMANAGIKGSQAGTALRGMLARLAKPTDEVSWAMNQLGLSLSNSDGTMKDFNELLLDLREGFAGLGEAERTEMAALLAGQEAMSGLLSIVGASDADFNKLTESINNADGAAKDMAATMANNLQGKLTLLKSSAEGFGLELYDKIQVPLTEMASWAVESLNELTTAFRENGVSGMVEAAGGIVGSAIGELTNALPQFASTAVEIVKNLANGIKDNLPQITEGAVATVETLADGIIDMLPDIIETGIKLILGLGEGLIKALPKLISKTPQIIRGIVSGLVSNLPDIVSVGWDIVKGLWQGIAGFIPWLWENIKGAFGGIVDGVKKMLGIHSPSRVFAGIGENMALGLSEGWDDKFSGVKKGITDGLDFSGDYAGSVTAKSSGIAAGGQSNTETLLAAILNKLDGMGVYLDGTTLTGYIDSSLGRKTEQNKRLALA